MRFFFFRLSAEARIFLKAAFVQRRRFNKKQLRLFKNKPKRKKEKKEKMRTNSNLKTLVECAILVALSFVLSFLKVWEMPFGGSVTLLSMLPVCVAALRHGPKWGLGTAFVYSITQALVSGAAGWGLSPKVLVICYLLDYIIAFTVLGLAGFAKGKSDAVQALSIVAVSFLRFISHYLSGVTIWASPEMYAGLEYGIANPYLYSLLYNGAYMLPEAIFTAIGAFIMIKALKSRKQL